LIPPKFKTAEGTKKKSGPDLKRKDPPADDEEKDPEILDELKLLRATRKEIKKIRHEKKDK